MLRHFDQHGGGVWVYTRNLLREMLALNTPHEFVLIYRNPEFVGTYRDRTRVREVAVPAPHVFWWDQVAVREVEKREKLDLIFNPKYSIPLRAKCRTVFVCHGCDWYVVPQWSPWIDRLSHKYLVPRYAHKADGIIAVSETTRKHVNRYLGVGFERLHTVYLGVGEQFFNPITEEQREEVRRKYGLPDRFYLYVGQIYPPKNFGRLIQAYAQVGPPQGISLVVAGQEAFLCDDEVALIDKLRLSSWVAKTGWIDHETLPVLYTLAEALVMPSLYEACPSPPLEAMATGCPVVTADRHGTLDVAGDAALLVNPEDVGSIAEGMRRIVSDQVLRKDLIETGSKHVLQFSWKKCAEETMQVLEKVGGGR